MPARTLFVRIWGIAYVKGHSKWTVCHQAPHHSSWCVSPRRASPWPWPRVSSVRSGGGSNISEKSAFGLLLVRQPIVHATTCGRCFRCRDPKRPLCGMEEVTFCSCSDADRIRVIRCAAQQLACIPHARINPIRGVGAVVLMGEVLVAFVGLWDLVATAMVL